MEPVLKSALPCPLFPCHLKERFVPPETLMSFLAIFLKCVSLGRKGHQRSFKPSDDNITGLGIISSSSSLGLLYCGVRTPASPLSSGSNKAAELLCLSTLQARIASSFDRKLRSAQRLSSCQMSGTNLLSLRPELFPQPVSLLEGSPTHKETEMMP